MRLLLFADLHLDAAFGWAGRQVARGRRQALRDTLTRVCDLAAHVQADALCCAGDLYEHERVSPDTGSFLRAAFARLHPLPVFLAPGNHDWLGPQSLYRRVAWTDNVQVFGSPRLSPVTLADGITVWGGAHCAPANTPGFLDGFATRRTGVNLALFHGSEQGDLPFQDRGKLPHAPFRAAQVPECGLDHALLGHFHTPRDAPHLTYPGNPEPLTFGETGERGAVLVTVAANGTVTRQRYRVAVSTVSDVTVRLDGVAHSGEIRERVAAVLAQHHDAVRVTLEGEVMPDIEVSLADLADLADLVAPGRGVQLRVGRVLVGYDFDRLAEERTVRGQFVRAVRAASDLDDEERRRVLVTGLRALDGRRQDLDVR
jgi:DNA repair protein SbcD/Mre11